MSESPNKTRVKRTPAQLAAHHQAKANAARGKAIKQARDVDARRKILLGAGLIGLVGAENADAIRIYDKILGALIRPHDRAAFDMPPLEPSVEVESAVSDDQALYEAAEAALVAYKATRNTGVPRAPFAQAWREAVIAFERKTGRFWTTTNDLESRQKFGLGKLGEMAVTA